MIKVNNRKTIRRLAGRSLRANPLRSVVAILAIALTTILFTSLFTIAMSFNDGVQLANFRQVGGSSHGTFKYLTEAQYDQLKTDPLIREYGLRRFVGIPREIPFNKTHVEVGYSDANVAKWMFAEPTEGRLPQEGSNEAATDTRVLALLGLEPVLGMEFTLSFAVDGQPTTETFTLCGWWPHDEAIMASHVLIPESRAEAIFSRLNTQGADGMTGRWNMYVMFASGLHIAQDMQTVLANQGFQNDSRTGEGYIAAGVNWAYTGAQLANSMDPLMLMAMVVLLLLIVFTGYLIIYNVFQIAVSNDIRFYGLLKTIGTTPRQLRRLIRWQALLLSAVGIPLGLLLGYAVGAVLTPMVLSQLNGVAQDALSLNPVIFVGAAAFSLVTVFLSCRKPGRLAGRVSPVEAVRYTEGGRQGKNTVRKRPGGASLWQMAWANMGRNRIRTVVTVVSMSLAVVLLNMTVIFTDGFDMDKYLARFVTDFVVADAGYFQSGSLFSEEEALPEEIIAEIEAQGSISAGGRVYGAAGDVQELVTEDYFRAVYSRWYAPENLEQRVAERRQPDSGLLTDWVQLYGMESYPLDQLTVLEGDISGLYRPGSRDIAAVYFLDDYGNPQMDSHWAQLGDTVTLRYVEAYEYYDHETGQLLDPEQLPEDGAYSARAVRYREENYKVTALAAVPNALSYRYYSNDAFVLNDQTFIQDSGTSSVLHYAFDAETGGEAAMETFLADFTENRYPQLDYESKATYAEEFEGFQGMFLLLGGVLSFIVGLVGVLNFVNAVLTGILTRRREFAVLQAIGMTGRQLQTMLIWEGLIYAVGALLLALLLSVALSPLLGPVMNGMFWFFTYRFTLRPVLWVLPVFLALGLGLPLAIYRVLARRSVVERLREAE